MSLGLSGICLPTKTFWYGDSLQWAPPINLLRSLQYLVKLLSEICPGDDSLKSRSWSRGTVQLQRFGMPLQQTTAGQEGSSSCGVATCLAAMDFCCLDLSSGSCRNLPRFHGISGMQENTGFSFCSCQVSRFGKMKDLIPINGLLSFELPVQMIISTQVIFSFFIGKDILELEKETHIL